MIGIPETVLLTGKEASAWGKKVKARGNGAEGFGKVLGFLASFTPFLGPLQSIAAHQLLFGHLHAVLCSVQAVWGELVLQARIAGA